MNPLVKKTSVISRKENLVKSALKSMAQEPDSCHAVAMRASLPTFYKGLVFTPHCVVAFDTGLSDEAEDYMRYVNREQAKARIEGWNKMPFKPEKISWMELVQNWREADRTYLNDGLPRWAIDTVDA